MSKIRRIKKKEMKDRIEKPSDDMYLPSLYMDMDSIPEAKEWEVGGKYRLVVDVTMSGMRQDDHGGTVDFKVEGVGVEERKTKKVKRY